MLHPPTSTRQVANGRWRCWGQSWWPCCSTWWPRCRQKQVLGISGHCGTTVSSFQIFQISKLLPFFHALTTLTTPWGTFSSPWHGCPSSFSFLRRWCCQNSPAETAWGTGWWVSSNISQERKGKTSSMQKWASDGQWDPNVRSTAYVDGDWSEQLKPLQGSTQHRNPQTSELSKNHTKNNMTVVLKHRPKSTYKIYRYNMYNEPQ